MNFSEGIKLNPDNSNLYNIRGECKCKLSEYQSAIFDFGKAIEINPLHVAAFRNREDIKFKLFRFNHGCSDWRKASELGDKKAVYLLSKYCK